MVAARFQAFARKEGKTPKAILLCAAFFQCYQIVTLIFSSDLGISVLFSAATALICHEGRRMGRGLTRKICTFADFHND